MRLASLPFAGGPDLILQSGFTRHALYSLMPMSTPRSLLMLSAPRRPVQHGAWRWRSLADQRPQQGSDLGHGEWQQLGGEVHRVHTPRSRPFGRRRDRRGRKSAGGYGGARPTPGGTA